MSPRVLFLAPLVLAPLVFVACKLKPSQDDVAPPAPAPVSSAPPAASSAVPVAQSAGAGDLTSKSAYELARDYESAGQYWMARLALERKALGSDGTKEETELLARICSEQGDEDCVASCGAKLGRKLKLDAGVPKGAASADRKDPAADMARARDLIAKGRFGDARAILEPKVLDGKPTKDEVRMLRLVCDREGDRMCVALCDAKLR